MAQADWTAGADEPALYAKGRMPVAAIIRTAMSLVAASWPRAWPAWLALTVVNVGTSAALLRMPQLGDLTAGVLGMVLLLVQQGLLAAPAAAVYRALSGAPRLWAMDAGVRRFVAISVGVFAVLLGWLMVLVLISALLTLFRASPSVNTGALLAWLLAFLGLLVAAFRLCLWPVANLLGKRVGWRSAWRQMDGAIVSLSIAMLALGAGAAAIPYVVSNLLPGVALKVTTVFLDVHPRGSLARIVVQNFAMAAVQWAMIATTAAVWRLRNGRGEGVAAVFD